MRDTGNESGVWAAWVFLVGALASAGGLGFAAWMHDVVSVVFSAVFGTLCLLAAALGFWCEGYTRCEHERVGVHHPENENTK